MTLSTMLRRPSAFLPLAMSLAALGLVLTVVSIFGVVHETDEGTAAHLWQLLMAGQLAGRRSLRASSGCPATRGRPCRC